jgi:hypothetical protein
MENIEILILSVVVMIAFVVFIVTSIKEFSKMEKEEYKYDPNAKKYGRDGIYYLLETLFEDVSLSKGDKKTLIKTIDRTMADMEFDGIYFPEKVKEDLKKKRDELYCEYSGLPSVKSYDNNQK